MPIVIDAIQQMPMNIDKHELGQNSIFHHCPASFPSAPPQPPGDCCKRPAKPAWSCGRTAWPWPFAFLWPQRESEWGLESPGDVNGFLWTVSSFRICKDILYGLINLIWLLKAFIVAVRWFGNRGMISQGPASKLGPNSSPTPAGPGDARPKNAAWWVFILQRGCAGHEMGIVG